MNDQRSSAASSADLRENFLRLESIFLYAAPSETKVVLADGTFYQFECDRFEADRGVITQGSRAVPVVRYRCRSDARPRLGTVIWFHGGPFQPFGNGELHAEQNALLATGYDLVLPLYVGSSDRVYEVSAGGVTPNMDDAVAEATALVQSLQTYGRVILVGESFGALPAAAAAPLLRENDALVLAAPLLLPLKQAMLQSGDPFAATLQQAAHRSKKREELAFSAFTARIENGVLEGKGTETPPDLEALGVHVLESFFGDWLDRDVQSLLEKKPPANLLVVYGDRDSRIGVDRVPALLARGGRRTAELVFKGSDHAPARNLEELRAFMRQIELLFP